MTNFSFKILICIFLLSIVVLRSQSIDKNQSNPTSENILAAEKKLSELGFWVRQIDSEIDDTTRYALLAFQRINGLKQTGNLTGKDLEILEKTKMISPKYADYPHFEVSLTKQIIFWVNDEGKVSRILPVSTGTGKKFTQGGWTRRAVTPKGTFKVFRKVDNWKSSPLGNMFFPSYFVGGVAIHGGDYFPNRPSTYGCIKVPLIFASELSGFMPFETIVVVYE